MKYRTTIITTITILFFAITSQAQDLDALLNEETADYTEYTLATFLNSRIVNGQSVEQIQKKGLDFRISHRFGTFKEGYGEFYGLDESNSYFVLDYGLTNQVMIGVGRATYNKQASAYLKFKLFRQSSGAKTMPVTVSLFTELAANTTKFSDEKRNKDFVSRLEYTTQLLIARKMNIISVQLTPTFVHRNLVNENDVPNDIWGLGVGGRYKLTSKWSVNAEYFYMSHSNMENIYNPLAFAISYQVSHHVFQLILTNSAPIASAASLGNTTNSWTNGNIRLGFNISTVF